MRSAAFTLFLLAAASLLGGGAGWCLLKGDLNVLFGVPATTPGHLLYSGFRPDQVTGIRIDTASGGAVFTKPSNGWMATHPWNDRMDAQAATAIITFTLGLRVEESAELDNVPIEETGLGEDQAIHIRLENADGRPLAKYRLGKVTPWLATVTDDSQRVPTVYVQPVDKNRKSHVFIATGDILPLFRNNLVHLRDHHPFYFHPDMLREVRIRSAKGKMTMARAKPADDSPWRITKPLELRTEPTAVLALVEGLFKLKAESLADQPAAPPPSPAAEEIEISLGYFNSANVSVLKVQAPASATATEVSATVSDRPGTEFLLPLSPRRDVVSLADLPLSVNELRDPALARLDRSQLHAVIIQPATGEDIHLMREDARRWTTRVDGSVCQANEIRLFELLNAMETHRALGFESDAATDFKPWGLDRPVLRLTFVARNGVSLTLRFGLDKTGRLFANRQGSPTVMRLDPLLLSKIAVNAYEWRQAQLWSVNRVDLLQIERQVPGQPPLVLKYDFFYDTWQAASGGQDLTDRLNALHANYLLGGVENIIVARWLAPNDPAATAALAKPTLTLIVTAKGVDEQGRETAPVPRKLEFAPLGGKLPAATYYGRMEGERYLFQIDPETYEKLALDPLDKGP
jgi:hypothetical protein